MRNRLPPTSPRPRKSQPSSTNPLPTRSRPPTTSPRPTTNRLLRKSLLPQKNRPQTTSPLPTRNRPPMARRPTMQPPMPARPQTVRPRPSTVSRCGTPPTRSARVASTVPCWPPCWTSTAMGSRMTPKPSATRKAWPMPRESVLPKAETRAMPANATVPRAATRRLKAAIPTSPTTAARISTGAVMRTMTWTRSLCPCPSPTAQMASPWGVR